MTIDQMARHLALPEHREVGPRKLAARGQVQPDLKELGGVLALFVEQREHLRVHDAAAGGHPLHVALAITRGRSERVGVIDEASAGDRDRLEATVWVAREPRHHVAVVHVPAVLVGEVLPDVAPDERRTRPELGVACRVVVLVVDAEQEGVERFPGGCAELHQLEHDTARAGTG